MSHCKYPCPCGYAGDPEKKCVCSPGIHEAHLLEDAQVTKYQNRISGPILDRIDIHLEVQRVPIAKLASLSSGESSTVIRERVEGARAARSQAVEGSCSRACDPLATRPAT